MAHPAGDIANPLEQAIAAYRGIFAYQTVIKAIAGNDRQNIRYYFKKPGHVRMELITPLQSAVVIYDPIAHQAKLWPFGHGNIPAIAVDPDNPLIRSPTGQRIDRSDIGALYQNVQTLQAHGAMGITDDEALQQETAAHVTITAPDDFSLGEICRYELWFDRRTNFPVKVESYDRGGGLIERVEMEDLRLNPELPDDFFSL